MSRTRASYFLVDIGGVLLRLEHGKVTARMQALTGLDSHQLQAALNRDALIHKFETGPHAGQRGFPCPLVYLSDFQIQLA